MIAGADILSRPSNHTVLVPVHFLEHYRFRLSPPDQQSGVDQGGGRPNDVYLQGQGHVEGGAAGQAVAGGSGTGEVRFLLELRIADIVGWFWRSDALTSDLQPLTSIAYAVYYLT